MRERHVTHLRSVLRLCRTLRRPAGGTTVRNAAARPRLPRARRSAGQPPEPALPHLVAAPGVAQDRRRPVPVRGHAHVSSPRQPAGADAAPPL